MCEFVYACECMCVYGVCVCVHVCVCVYVYVRVRVHVQIVRLQPVYHHVLHAVDLLSSRIVSHLLTHSAHRDFCKDRTLLVTVR